MKLSIITINYNNLEGLKRTYESVVCQTWTDYEWIIIDGGSTDGSREFIEEHQDKFTYWCSKPDKGIYNAMNKGIAKASGKYLQFLNSGDCFVDKDVLLDFIYLGWEEDIISGDIILDGNIENVRCNPEDDVLDFDYMRIGSITHPSSFINRLLFQNYGFYDENLQIVSDWKFFLNSLIIHNCSYRHWHRFVVDFNSDGISESLNHRQILLDERARVLNNFKRITNPIEKRDKRIQELDLPVMIILRKKIIAKVRMILGRC